MKRLLILKIKKSLKSNSAAKTTTFISQMKTKCILFPLKLEIVMKGKKRKEEEKMQLLNKKKLL